MSGCCTSDGSCHTEAGAGAGAGAVSTVYTVTGMTCGHCVNAVTEELTQVDGVSGVRVDLEAGTVTVDSAAEPDDKAIAEAVDEAGYELTGRAAATA